MKQEVGLDVIDKRKFLVYGGVASVLFDASIYPIELIKTRWQVQGSGVSSTAGSVPKYTGVLNAAVSTVRLEGIRGLFKGYLPAAAGMLPTQLLYYGSYEYSRLLLKSHFNEDANSDLRDVCVELVAGSVAEIVSAVAWVPSDVVSQRLQIQGPNTKFHVYKNARDVIRKIVRAHGVRGLYTGLVPSLWTHIPGSAICWSVYDYSKKIMYRRLDGGEDHPGSHLVNMAAGLLGGGACALATNPFDLVRVRIQAQDRHLHIPTSIHSLSDAGLSMRTSGKFIGPYSGTLFSAVSYIFKQEGLVGLFRGVLPRTLYIAPSCSATLVLYEIVKNLALQKT